MRREITLKMRWNNPVLGLDAEETYKDLYAEEGSAYVDILETSPYEIAVVSRMLAYLDEIREGER